MRDMAHSICLIKLYQITMRKNLDFLFLDYLNSMIYKKQDALSDILLDRVRALMTAPGALKKLA